MAISGWSDPPVDIFGSWHKIAPRLPDYYYPPRAGFFVSGVAMCWFSSGGRAAAEKQQVAGSMPAISTIFSSPAMRRVFSLERIMSEELKLYTCHKQVHARPMNRGDYNKLQGWDMPANENGADDGYLVIYNKDTADHYVSWSPKHIFDAGYDEAVVLTEADSLTDLAGTLRPDHPSVASR